MMPSKEAADLATLRLADLKDRRRWFRISQDEYEQQEIVLRLQGAHDVVELGARAHLDGLCDPALVQRAIRMLSQRYERGEMSEDEFREAATPWVLSERGANGGE